MINYDENGPSGDCMHKNAEQLNGGEGYWDGNDVCLCSTLLRRWKGQLMQAGVECVRAWPCAWAWRLITTIFERERNKDVAEEKRLDTFCYNTHQFFCTHLSNSFPQHHSKTLFHHHYYYFTNQIIFTKIIFSISKGKKTHSSFLN